MIPNPILKVLSTLTTRRVRFLLMGGQACVLYGATEFSRDTDIALFHDPANVLALEQALVDLHAKVIAVPPFDAEYLRRGFAVHFRCEHPDTEDMRLDVMSVMRGVAPFDELWTRRLTMHPNREPVEVMGLPDLIQAKKTQRDKDWPMIRRLVESHYNLYYSEPTEERIRFWLRESRTPAMLEALAQQYPDEVAEVAQRRPLLRSIGASSNSIEEGLAVEERLEREADRHYWTPLKKELERLRQRRQEPT